MHSCPRPASVVPSLTRKLARVERGKIAERRELREKTKPMEVLNRRQGVEGPGAERERERWG